MDTYSVETDGHGGYQVRVTSSRDETSRIVFDFPTWTHARGWIDNQLQLIQSTETASGEA
jgi:hypothetical protein